MLELQLDSNHSGVAVVKGYSIETAKDGTEHLSPVKAKYYLVRVFEASHISGPQEEICRASSFHTHTADEDLRDRLEKQLAMLKHQGVIETWHDRRIGAGEDLNRAIDDHINSDDIILLLVSPDFIASNYCYNIEMRRAMERHERGRLLSFR